MIEPDSIHTGTDLQRPRSAHRPPGHARGGFIAPGFQRELDTAGVSASDVPVDDRVEQPFGGDSARAFVFDRYVGVTPVRNIQGMRAPAPQETDGVIVDEPASDADYTVVGVRLERSGFGWSW